MYDGLTEQQASLVLMASNLMSLSKPSKSERTNVRSYLERRRRVQAEEQAYIYHEEDLMTLRTGCADAPVNDILNGLLRLLHCSVVEVRSMCFRNKLMLTWNKRIFCSQVSEMFIEAMLLLIQQ